MISTYPESPGFKVKGPSQDAAIAESDRAPSLRDRVLVTLILGQYTADEVAAKLQASILSVRPRHVSGHSATVWRAVLQPKQKELFA